jgi:hypothetical protein
MLTSILKSFAALLIPHALEWLQTRAMIIPHSKLPDVAAQIGTDPATLQNITSNVAADVTQLGADYLSKHFGL